MATLNETIRENIRAAHEFFDIHEWPQLESAYLDVVDETLPPWERKSGSRRIATAYESVLNCSYNGQERAQARAQMETWKTIEARLGY